MESLIHKAHHAFDFLNQETFVWGLDIKEKYLLRFQRLDPYYQEADH
jgi:hypothetical protein